MSVLNSLTFTPSAAGKLIVTCTYSARVTAGGSDWGAGIVSRCYCIQSGSTSYGDSLKLSTTRLSQIARFVFDVAAGASIECGLDGYLGGVFSASWWDITITAELIKK